MFGALYRSTSANPQPPSLIERDAARSYEANLGAASIGGMGLSPPESAAEFQEFFETLVVVHRCASLNAGAISAATLRCYDDLGDGERDEITDRTHPLRRLLSRPNPNMSGRRFVHMVQLHKELTGNAYVEIVKKPVPGQLWPMDPAKVTINADPKRGVTGYTYKPGGFGKAEVFSVNEVWHDWFANPNDELRGLPPLRPAREHVISNALLEQGMLSILRNGMRLGGVLTVEKDVSDKALDRLYDDLKAMFGGVMNWGKTLVAAGGKKFQALTQTPEQIQASELRAWNTGKIMRAYGVWPIIFGDVDLSATRENATTQMLLYQWLTVMPRATSLAEEMSERLLPMLQIKGTEMAMCEFDFSETPFSKQMALEEAQAQSALIAQGILTPNEVRATLGYEPRDGGDDAQAVAMGRAVLESSELQRLRMPGERGDIERARALLAIARDSRALLGEAA